MRKHGYSFIELLCVLAIVGISCLATMPSLLSFIYKIQATLTMQQIELAINYGRSLAIAHARQVTIRIGNNGMLVNAPNGQTFFFKTYLAHSSQLSLAQSGFIPQTMTIEANGLTNYNGCFNYKSLKFSVLPQFKLYFNKALRIYTVQVDENK